MYHKPHIGTTSNLSAITASAVRKVVSPRRGEIIPILKGVDFQAAWGQLTGIVGPSGSGKSTLLYCLAGLDSVSSGTVSVLGNKVSEMSPTASARFRRAHLGFVFQSYNLVPSMTVEDNVKLPFTLRGLRFPRDMADSVLARLGIGMLPGSVIILTTLFISPTLGFDRLDHYLALLDCIIAAGVTLLIVGCCIRKAHTKTVLGHDSLVSLGNASYSLYLIHAPLLALVWTVIHTYISNQVMDFMLLLPIGGIVSLLVTIPFYQVFEKPFTAHIVRRKQS